MYSFCSAYASNDEDEYLKMNSRLDNKPADAAVQDTLEVTSKINAHKKQEEDDVDQHCEEDKKTNEEIYSYDRLLEKSTADYDYACITDDSRTISRRWIGERSMMDGYVNSSTPLPLKDKDTSEIHGYYTLEDISKTSKEIHKNIILDSDNYSEVQLDSLRTNRALEISEDQRVVGNTLKGRIDQCDDVVYYT